ncbi:hypothetical protein [Cellulosimicrobium sp. CUA-896]|uniref:hypothetical protein n=1 Tax=Cellulosimicrobium sp. CUA-896 TaxID=1517881 RepID=UPI001115254C|nr:hypothetical protein [Cellulosimicrobium sp. CUA-896]
MRSRARLVAHGVVLAVLAGLCVTTAASGAFDVVTIPSSPAAPAPAPSPAADGGAGPVAPETGGAGAGDAPTDADADAGGGGATPQDPEGATPDGATPDPACLAAERAWADAAAAQLDVTVEHPEELVEGFTTARDALVAAEPPADIARDWGVVATYVRMIADAVEAAGPDDRAELARALDRVGRGSTPRRSPGPRSVSPSSSARGARPERARPRCARRRMGFLTWAGLPDCGIRAGRAADRP